MPKTLAPLNAPAPAAFSIAHRVGRFRAMEQGPTHVNPGFELSWVSAGRMEFELPRARARGAAGSCVLLPPDLLNTPYAVSLDVHQLMLSPAFMQEAQEALGRGARLPAGHRVYPPGARLGALCHALALETAQLPPGDPAVGALVQAIALSLVREDASPVERGRSAGVGRAIALMEAHLDRPLRVEDLAIAAGLPRFPFLRTFRAQVGDSPYHYLTRLRLDRAAERLRSGAASILELALECGFQDPGRFARTFTRRYGCSPSAYRARFAR